MSVRISIYSAALGDVSVDLDRRPQMLHPDRERESIKNELDRAVSQILRAYEIKETD